MDSFLFTANGTPSPKSLGPLFLGGIDKQHVEPELWISTEVTESVPTRGGTCLAHGRQGMKQD